MQNKSFNYYIYKCFKIIICFQACNKIISMYFAVIILAYWCVLVSIGFIIFMFLLSHFSLKAPVIIFFCSIWATSLYSSHVFLYNKMLQAHSIHILLQIWNQLFIQGIVILIMNVQSGYYTSSLLLRCLFFITFSIKKE